MYFITMPALQSTAPLWVLCSAPIGAPSAPRRLAHWHGARSRGAGEGPVGGYRAFPFEPFPKWPES